MKKTITAILLLIFCSIQLFSQIVVDAEIRPRTEFRNGYKKTQAKIGETPEFVTSQRTGIGLLFQSKFIGYIHVQDVRTWGETTTKKDIATLHLKEGWVELPFLNHFKAKIGRQLLKYNNQRILAATNWNQVGTQHDLLLLKYKRDKLSIHTGLAYNNENASQSFESYYPVPYYKMLFFGWENYNLDDKLNISLLGVTDLNQKDSTKSNYTRYTYGGTVIYKPLNSVKLNVTGYIQQGHNSTGTRVNAYMFTIKSDFSFSSKTNLFAGADLFSGKDPYDSTGVDKVFNNLYGARHKYLGYMDYFPENHFGIFDGFAGINLKVFQQTKLELTLHNFWLPHEYTDLKNPQDQINKYLGSEIDLKIDCQLSENAQLSFIHGIVFGTSAMDLVKGGNHHETSNFAMLMLTWNPKFLVDKSNK